MTETASQEPLDGGSVRWRALGCRTGRIAFAVLLAWCGLIEAVQLFARCFFHTWVAGDWFLIFLASDADEMLKFVELNANGLVLCASIALLGIVLGLVSLWLSKRAWLILCGLFVLYVAQGVLRWGAVWSPAYLAYDTLRGMRDYGRLVTAGRWTAEDERLLAASGVESATNDCSVLVLVIGESTTASRMGVYGYAKDTTPELRAWSTNGLVVLPPRRASSSYTAKALQELFVRDGESLVRRLRREGRHAVLVSAQRHWERYCGVEQMVFAACERKRYLSDECGGSPYTDLALVGLVERELGTADRPLLLIVHLIGSHFPYRARYPDYWTRDEGMDDYDMSVRVTDKVVSSVLRMLPPDGVLLFTSDHGETPGSGSYRNADDPDLWRVPLLAYPARGVAFAERLGWR